MSTGNRRSVYFSKNKDKDILQYIQPLLKHYNYSTIVKDLMRDGIKYRQQIKASTNVIQSNTFSQKKNLQPIHLKQKEVSKKEIEDRLDNF